MVFIWILVSILIFSIIVLIHELWHFLSARFFWVKVEEFGLWIPPRAKKLWVDKKGTLYSLNWLPLWGFVKLTWETPDNLIKSEKYNLLNKPYWQQSIIILAWVLFNFLLASIIFSILFFVWVKPIWINTQIETDLNLRIIPTYEQAIKSWILIKKEWVVLYPTPSSIAEKSWIIEWDILIKLKSPHHPTGTSPQWEEEIISSPEQLKDIIWNNSWKEIIFTIKRNNEIIKIPVIPSPLGGGLGRGQIWSYLSENIELNQNFKYKFWFLDSVKYWFSETYNHSLLTLKWLGILVKKVFNPKTPEERSEAIDQVSGPIWIVDFITNALSWWFVFLIILWAILSVSLWVFNLLPIPALDWWRFIFIVINWIIQKIFWKKMINEYIESIIHVLFFIFLIALSLLIAYNDVVKIIDK